MGGTRYRPPVAAQGVAALTYSASMTPDASKGAYHKIVVTNGTAMTINAPTNPPAVAGPTLTFEFLNSSGGAMGAVTWNAAFKPAGAFTAPANTKRRTIQFQWDGTNWVETARVAADI